MSPESRPMSFSVGTITTFVMPHMQNVRGDLFGGELMALVDQAAAVAAQSPPRTSARRGPSRRQA